MALTCSLWIKIRALHTQRPGERLRSALTADQQNTRNAWKQGEVHKGQERGSCIVVRNGTDRRAPMREPAPFPRHTQAQSVKTRCEAVAHATTSVPSTSRWARPLCSPSSACGPSQPPAAAQSTDPQPTQAVQEGPGGPLLTTQHSTLSHGPDPPWIRASIGTKICVSAMANQRARKKKPLCDNLAFSYLASYRPPKSASEKPGNDKANGHINW